MRNIFKIYKRDIKSMFTNPVALIIIVGLCVIPSLYAWINIKACWDPYTNTGDIPVAIVNNDSGATLAGKEINIGDSVVEQLKDNKSIGWKFVNQKTADMGVMDGTYYAEIEIPSDFSKDLTSVATGTPVKANIVYKVNTKLNPVANKITDVAQSTLVEQIKTSFLDTVNEEVFDKLNLAGNQLDQNKDKIVELKKAVINVNNNMDLITNALNGVNSGATSLDSYLQTMKTALPQISSSLSNIQNATVNTNGLINNTNSTLNAAFDNISANLGIAEAEAQKINDKISSLNINNMTAAQMKDVLSQINAQLDNINNSVNGVTSFLESINKDNPNSLVTSLIENLKNVSGAISNEKGNIETANGVIDQAGEVKESALQALKTGANSIATGLSNANDSYNNSTRPALNTIGQGLSSATQTAADLINKANGLVSQMSNVINTASSDAQVAANTASSLNQTLNQFKGVISELSKTLSGINNNDLSKIISVLQGNPQMMGGFMSTPFNVKTERVYPVANYGSGMTPVYTVLALWVGALLLTSLLKVYPVKLEGLENTTVRERHFGKMLTFVTIGIIQSIIVSLGNKYLLGVQIVSVPVMLLISILTAITFAVIIFTLVSLFGNMGKAIAIVLMVTQLAGTGGTYPVQVLPLFFRIIQPLVPFTYGVDGYREAVAGPLASHVAMDSIVLCVFTIVFILIGYFLKPVLEAPMKKFEAKFEESGIGE